MADEVEHLMDRLYCLPEPDSARSYPILLKGKTAYVEQQPWI